MVEVPLAVLATALAWQLLLPTCFLLETALLEPSCWALRSPRPTGRPQGDALVDSPSWDPNRQPVLMGSHM